MTTIAERVAAGAAFLDEQEPGWDQRIDLDRLYIGSSCRCILGQLHGSFGLGLMETGLVDSEPELDVALGFFWAETRSLYEHEAEVSALAAEWKRVIAGRRSAS